MEAGLGGTSLDWTRVQGPLSERCRVCAYDRAGYGWSEPGPLPRSSETIVGELHTLLERAGLPGPYLLVGHSFGGYHVRLFAARYPRETAALVLVDASHEGQFDRFEALGLTLVPRPGGLLRASGPAAVPAALPVEARLLAQALMAAPAAQHTLRAELASFRGSAEQVAASAPSPGLPVLVVTRGRSEWPDTPSGRRLEGTWRDLQRDLARRTGAGAQVIAERSGHFVQLDEPEVVIEAVAGLLRRLGERPGASEAVTARRRR
jgi:pimeloyl-ACP methyl ester carboxylesterase